MMRNDSPDIDASAALLVGADQREIVTPVVVRVGSSGFEFGVAFLVAFVIAFRFSLPPDVPIGYLVAGALLPITIGSARSYSGALAVALATVIAAVAGVVLTLAAGDNGLADSTIAIIQTSRVLGLGIGTLALLWVRSTIGTRNLVLAFGLGLLVSLGLTGVNPANPWKFSIATPTILILLGMPRVFGHPRREALALFVLAAVSGLNDSRSAAGILLVAAALCVSQARTTGQRASPALVTIRLALAVTGTYFLVKAALLDGILGETAQARTEAQIHLSGSVLLGGRPELGAWTALVRDRLWGYGAGAVPSSGDVRSAKVGMSALGYDPNNGYVNNYMFGNGFEVHSLLGDLWILFGVPGAILALLLAVCFTRGIVISISNRIASGALLFLGISFLWNFIFSPFPSVMLTLMLAVAVVLPRSTHVVSTTSRQLVFALRPRRWA